MTASETGVDNKLLVQQKRINLVVSARGIVGN
jgi:hypothetical protein